MYFHRIFSKGIYSFKALLHQRDKLTAFPHRQKMQVRSVQSLTTLYARCVRAVCALCRRLERHAAAIILNMHKDNAAALRLQNALIKRCRVAVTLLRGLERIQMNSALQLN